MSEDKIQAAITLGSKAKKLLEDETFIKATQEIEAEIFTFWKRAADPVERNRAWEVLQMGEKYRAMLVVYANNGKIAQSDLDAILAQGKSS